MPATLKRGQLVEIAGNELLDTPQEYRKEVYDGPRNLLGQRGQLVDWKEDAGHWIAVTYGASLVAVREEQIRPLNFEEVQEFDIVLGPASSPQVMGRELTDTVSRKGFALCKLFVSAADLEDMVSTSDRLAEEGAFSRLAAEIEPGYLGRDGAGKIVSVDFDAVDTAAFVKDSALRIFDDSIARIGTLMRPHTETQLGFDLYSRSSTMIALPFDDDEDAYVAPDLDNEEAATYLKMMWRAKVMVLVNAGPSSATMTFIPKLRGDKEPTVTVEPGMLVVFSVDRYKFAYRPHGKAMAMSSLFLDAPMQYTLENLRGDLSILTGSNSGAPPPKTEHIPVVSMGTRYAFGVDEPWKLWVAYSKAGWDTLIRHPFARWDCDVYYEPNADQTSGKSYTCHGGFSDGIELFDCKFFDISPAEAKGMDPTQQQVLEVSYISLQGAGYNKRQLQSKPANIACFVGLDKNEWGSIPKEISGGFGASSNANAITSNRFNYCMNLKGASMTIDTACSASLVCTHTGKLYLLHKHYDPCEAVIICGVNLSLSPFTYIGGCGAGMHSHLGRCFTYNFSADGYARGEATASAGLKLHTFDRETGDLGLLAGSQVNQDGRSASLTAPNGPSQERCTQAVLKEINLKPPEIDTTECHGTGTSLGDPIEIGAYRKVMSSMPRHEPVVITSSKSNIGHCEGSAGISGLLKCVLLSMYSEATPNCHLSCLNPHLDMEGFPAIITSEGCVYRAEGSYNGVLSFGFGGTNACAMVWGVNQMTSRSVTSTKDMYQLAWKKMQEAPAQEVTINGEDWEAWEMDGPGRATDKPGDKWEVEIFEDGEVTYAEQEKKLPELGNSYYLTGTANGWSFDYLDSHESIPGLYVTTLTLGARGEEEFQVVADQNPAMTFYPSEPRCPVKSIPVSGPSEAQKESAWVIRGNEGDKFRVEFFKSDAGKLSLSWVREK